MAEILSHAKRYAVPLILLLLGLFFQFFVLPSSFPQSHYDVLGVRRFASVEEVNDAYEKLTSKFSGSGLTDTVEFRKIRYAFELLTHPLRKRDYDNFGIDEQLHVIEKVQGEDSGDNLSNIYIPLLGSSLSDSVSHGSSVLTPDEFPYFVGNSRAVLLQVYSAGSQRSAQFVNSWKRVVSLLDGVADTGVVDLGDVQLAAYLAEQKFGKQPFFRNGLPALVAFPPHCKRSNCYVRYQGDLSPDAIVDWMATSILGLPRIPYYSKESLVQNFIRKKGHHKVKVIFFSKSGERALPFLRKAAKDYWDYASFAFVLWREEEASIWMEMLRVESAPAVLFLKDKASIHYGNVNSSQILNLMEENKYPALPQLRAVTSMELGCDPRGHSRAGEGTPVWYCVVLAGRPSMELSNMRETILRVKSTLADGVDSKTSDDTNKDNSPVPIPAASALKEKRLSFAWLDGEAQKKYCLFYLNSENSYEACGPRTAPIDVPKLFIVRYKRKSTQNDLKDEKKDKNIWDTLLEKDANLASQLVAKYNGTDDVEKIMQWISWIIEDGDTKELPYYVETIPDLVPEDSEHIWSKGAQGVVSTSKGIPQKVRSIVDNIFDYMRDPRVGPILLLGACLSFGTIMLQNSQRSRPNRPTEEVAEGTDRTRPRRRPKTKDSANDTPPSITDEEPKGAYQLLPTDSDSE